MSRGKRKHRSRKAGLPPGTSLYTGPPVERPVSLRVLDFDATTCDVHEIRDVAQLHPLLTSATTSWICVDGVHDVDLVARIGQVFDLHPLVLEDVSNVGQQPKADDFGNYLFIVLRMPNYDAATKTLGFEQVSVILGERYVLSFHENAPPFFEALHQRLGQTASQSRSRGPDYLAYRLIDTIVDTFFVVMEQLGETIDGLQDRLLDMPDRGMLREVLEVRTALTNLRRAVWPLREMLDVVFRENNRLITAETRVFLRDVADHAFQIMDFLETERDILAGIHDMYINSINLRLNEVMKVLAVITTIFMPMSFVASVYGMNFRDMPELNSPLGYPIALALMAAIGIGMWFWFKRRRWI